MHEAIMLAEAIIPAILTGLAFAICAICASDKETPMKAVTVYWALVCILWAIKTFG